MKNQKTVRAGNGRKQNIKKNNKLNILMKKKLAGLFVCVVLALLCLLTRLVYLAAVKGEMYSQHVLASSQSHYSSSSIAYKRGEILDRNGNVLATSEKRYNVILDCHAANSGDGRYVEETITALTTVFGLGEDAMREKLTSEKTRESQYQVVKKRITIEEKQSYDVYMNGTKEHPLDDKTKQERKSVKGIWFEDEYVRTYPMGSLAGEVIGFTYDRNLAGWGLEGYYNNTLNGVDGRKYGYWGADTEIEQTIVEPEDGNSIRTTLDVTIQGAVENVIADFSDAYREGPYSSKRAAANIGVIVMNPNDGSILAMATSEGYDPNNPTDLSAYFDESQIRAMNDDQMEENLNKIWKNYCISDAFEPGSVFKPVTTAAALESGRISEQAAFYCDGYETVSGIRIKCSSVDGHGEEDLSEVIANSCNDALMQIGSSVGVENFCKYQKIFNFGLKTGIDLSGEAVGIVRTTETMGSVDLATASFGQGFTCTMLQETAAIASIINGGYYFKPHLVSSILDSDGHVVKSSESVLLKQTISTEVSDIIRSYMKASVDRGTSQYSKVDGYSMGGKTGTAQKIPRGNGKYLVSFVGFAPYEDPEVVIYVVIDEPNVEEQADSRYPQWIARDILKEVLPYMNVYPDEPSNPANVYLSRGYRDPNGSTASDTITDTNVPEPQSFGSADEEDGGDYQETDGYTNEEAGIDFE